MPSPDLNAIKGRRPVLQNCSFAELEIDPEYQRSIDTSRSQRLIRSIARDWDWRLCQPLVVARRRGVDVLHDQVARGRARLASTSQPRGASGRKSIATGSPWRQ